MKLTVLGCGDAFGNGGRNNTSFLLSDQEEHVLVDCGASTLIRLQHESIDLEKISTIIVSHFHGDHFGGIPFFLVSSLFEKKRQTPLHIAGPSGVKEKVFRLLEAMYEGTCEKLIELDLQFHEYRKNEGLQIHGKKIFAWSVDHSPPSDPHGIRLEWKDKIFAFSGDTSWTDNLIEMSDAAGLFVCECNFLKNQAFGHLSLKELTIKKRAINCENIWLTHMGNEVLELRNTEFNRLEDGLTLEF